jgi:hypothetical protein
VFSRSTTPIPLSPEDRTKASVVYDRWGQSLSAFEHSPAVSASSSKFDAFLAGKYTLSADETAGYNLFRGKANCTSCHLDGRSATRSFKRSWEAPRSGGSSSALKFGGVVPRIANHAGACDEQETARHSNIPRTKCA